MQIKERDGIQDISNLSLGMKGSFRKNQEF